MDTILIAALGILLGGVVNALGDDLPAGRKLGFPKYPDGQRRPILAWLGVSAFLTSLRRGPGTDRTKTSVAERAGSTIPLSWRYPFTELFLSALMTITYVYTVRDPAASYGHLLIRQAQVALLVLIAVVDLEHRQILFSPLLAAVLLALISAAVYPQFPPTLASMMAGALCAGVTFSLVYLGGRLFGYLAAKFRGHSLEVTVFGLGDVCLMTAGGLIVGFPNILLAMVLTILLGGIGALSYLAVQVASGRGYKPFGALPYGVHILLATYTLMVFPNELSHVFFAL